MGCYEQYSLSVGVSKLWDDGGNNRTRIRIYVNVYAGCWYYQNYGTDAYVHIDTGGAVVDDYGTNHGTSWTPWSIARPTQTSLNGNNQWTGIWSGDYWLYHDANGYVSYRVYGSFESWGTYGTPTLTADTNWTTSGMSDYDRSAYAPAMGTTTRDSTTSATIRYTQNGSVNNSPTTYVVQRATDSGFANVDKTWTNPATTFTDSTLNANTTYWYRAYAYGNEGGNKFSPTSVGPLYGEPTVPQSVSATQISTANDRVSVSFYAPSYGGNLQSYTITRNGTPSKEITEITSSPFIDTDANLVPGNSYTYSIKAVGSAFTGPNATTASVTAPGTPYAPTSAPSISNIGLNMTVVSAAVSGNGGVAINSANANEGYFIQYQLADTLAGTYGYGGTAGAWSPAIKMSDQTNRSHTYSSMTPAKYYKFRTYAANTVTKASDNTTNIAYPHINSTYTSGVNFATNSTGYFLAAGGKRYDGSAWIPTQSAKRYDGAAWQPLTIARRFDGTNWVPLS